jgi:hypothetical protein
MGWLNQLVTESQLPESSVLSIVDDEGTILVHSLGPTGMVGQKVQNSPLVQAMLTHQEGTSELVGLDGVERLYGFSQVPGEFVSNINVGIGVSKESAFARANAISPAPDCIGDRFGDDAGSHLVWGRPFRPSESESYSQGHPAPGRRRFERPDRVEIR